MPFTLEQFLGAFARYNEAIWPGQWLLNLAGVAIVALAFHGGRRAGRVAVALLAGLWLWAATVYQASFFADVTDAAYVFAVVFGLQAILLVLIASGDARFRFDRRADARSVVGSIVALYALVGYPLVGALAGHEYPRTPTFGVPCPVTILTFGLMLWAAPTAPRRLLLIPFAWTLVATTAAVRFGMVEDYGLAVAALATIALGRWRGGVIAPPGALAHP